MKSLKYYILVFVLSLVCGQYKLFAQDASMKEREACLYLTSQIDKLIKASQIQIDKNLIFNFLLCFDDKYSNSAELGEYSDEVLFKLLEDYPNLILEVMSLNKDKIPWKDICNKIADPIIVSDVNILNGIINKVNVIIEYDNIKKDVIDALKKAIVYVTSGRSY